MPLAGLPLIVSLVVFGWEGLFLTLFILSAPFGGFLFLMLVTPVKKWAHEASALAGGWVGAILGSVAGLKIAETI